MEEPSVESSSRVSFPAKEQTAVGKRRSIPPDLLPGPDTDSSVEIVVHDATRFDWHVTLPLPLPAHGRIPYVIETTFELPSAAARRSPWDQLQCVTRLDSPSSVSMVGDASINTIRRGVLALIQMLRRARTGFARHCRAAADPTVGMAGMTAEEFLTTWLEAALLTVFRAREDLVRSTAPESEELRTERVLADEFISIRLLDWLAEAQHVLDTTVRIARHPSQGAGIALEAVDDRLARALDDELLYRRAKNFPYADPNEPATLERYVERAGRLKKHFQEVLVLDQEVHQLDDRVQQWVTSLAALFAGASAFFLQLIVGRSSWSAETRISSGAIAVTVLAGLIYAARDRIKEMSRAWLTGKVYRFHAQRGIRYWIPERRHSRKTLLVRAREWCNETTSVVPDPLNPESGATMLVTQVHHIHRGHLGHHAVLRGAGVNRIRYIFRYDLSPLLLRIQDSWKRIPVIDPTTRRARFIEAPRRYQIPLNVTVTIGGRTQSRRASVVIDKQGIRRLD